ncbi:TPA: hypothetical protein KOO48_001929 [Clostridioides difficile]|nr:hypothetical protein [Clostridioides difficile]HBF9108034.1 hypothetical protein [Clostridioides difficile]
MSGYAELINRSMGYAEYLTNEMYIDGKSSKGKNDLTKEELFELLEAVRNTLYEYYNDGAIDLGWID